MLETQVRLISHRGNTFGPRPGQENHPDYIDAAASAGYDVEVDLWGWDGAIYLGHDKPQTPIDLGWLLSRQSWLWLHCKNGAAVSLVVNSRLNWFFHENDAYTLTSHGYIWTFPGKPVLKGPSIGLTFDPGNPLESPDFAEASGICGDYVGSWTRP